MLEVRAVAGAQLEHGAGQALQELLAAPDVLARGLALKHVLVEPREERIADVLLGGGGRVHFFPPLLSVCRSASSAAMPRTSRATTSPNSPSGTLVSSTSASR